MYFYSPGREGGILIIECLTVGPFAENTYLLGDEDSRDAYVIDPGGDTDRILRLVSNHGLTLRGIINTHGHIDHIAGVQELKDRTGIPFAIHEQELFTLENAPQAAALFGMFNLRKPEVDRFLQDGELLSLGNKTIQVVATPGHSLGGVSFHIENSIFVGDALFAGSIGRTDFPGGDYQTLISSIKNRILTLPDDAIVYSGHGPETTVGWERRTNPFLTGGVS